MICPSCATYNRDDARFCKYCGFDLAKAPKPAVPTPPAPPAPPPKKGLAALFSRKPKK